MALVIAFLIFSVGTVIALTEEICCLTNQTNPNICTIEGFRTSMNTTSDDDYQWHGKQTYINSYGSIRNPADQSIGMFVTMFFYLY